MILTTRVQKRSNSSIDIILSINKNDLLSFLDFDVSKSKLGRPFALDANQLKAFKLDLINGLTVPELAHKYALGQETIKRYARRLHNHDNSVNQSKN